MVACFVYRLSSALVQHCLTPFLSLSLSPALCCVQGSSAQTCGGCTTSCSGGSTEDNPDADQCCGWDNPAVDDDPDSLRDPRRFPQGFTTAVMPRLESDDPRPCVTVTIDDTSRQTYIQVALESDSLIW